MIVFDSSFCSSPGPAGEVNMKQSELLNILDSWGVSSSSKFHAQNWFGGTKAKNPMFECYPHPKIYADITLFHSWNWVPGFLISRMKMKKATQINSPAVQSQGSTLFAHRLEPALWRKGGTWTESGSNTLTYMHNLSVYEQWGKLIPQIPFEYEWANNLEWAWTQCVNLVH